MPDAQLLSYIKEGIDRSNQKLDSVILSHTELSVKFDNHKQYMNSKLSDVNSDYEELRSNCEDLKKKSEKYHNDKLVIKGIFIGIGALLYALGGKVLSGIGLITKVFT